MFLQRVMNLYFLIFVSFIHVRLYVSVVDHENTNLSICLSLCIENIFVLLKRNVKFENNRILRSEDGSNDVFNSVEEQKKYKQYFIELEAMLRDVGFTKEVN